jgi:hypothetical protein
MNGAHTTIRCATFSHQPRVREQRWFRWLKIVEKNDVKFAEKLVRNGNDQQKGQTKEGNTRERANKQTADERTEKKTDDARK